MEFGKYIEELRKNKGFSQRQLAQMSGVSNTEIWRIERGDRKAVSPDTLKKLAPWLGTTHEELMIAAGHLTKADDQDKQARLEAAREALANAEQQQTPRTLGGLEIYPVKKENLRMIPVYGRVGAGEGILANEDIKDWWPIDLSIYNFHEDLSQYFFLSVQGDSMEPILYEGDLVLVHKGPVDDGDIAVVIVDGLEGCVKRVEILEDQNLVVLHSKNPAYPPKTWALADTRFVGKVVWRTGNVRW